MSEEEKKEKVVVEIPEVEKELEDIQENLVYDSDGVARGCSPGRPPSSNGSVGSAGSGGSRGKRRTWKKPKDKPKRPLSAYNIFFKHERSRIVEGKSDDPTAAEVIRSIEGVLSTSRETRRHRKTHGRISFGDLARKIAEQWKGIGTEHKAVFEHYAELDMRRYRKELKLWKEKKETEALGRGSMHNNMDDSFSSLDGESDHLNANSISSDGAWAPRKNFYDSMNSSFSSSCSIDSDLSLGPIPIGRMLQNATPNMHASMPNIGLDTGIPGFVQGGFQANSNMQQAEHSMQQYGQSSLSEMHMRGAHQGVQMDGLNGSFDRLQMGHMQQQMQQHNSMQQQMQHSTGSLEQQRHQLLMQQQLLQQQQQQLQRQIEMQQNSMQQSSMQSQMQQGMNDPLPYDVFSNDTASGNDQGDQLENFLSNLDLSNV